MAWGKWKARWAWGSIRAMPQGDGLPRWLLSQLTKRLDEGAISTIRAYARLVHASMLCLWAHGVSSTEAERLP